MRPRLIALLLVITLTGCNAITNPSSQPLPTVVLDNNTTSAPAAAPAGSASVTASGVVVPSQEGQLAFSSGGNVAAVEVAEGDQVQARQVLIRLAGSEQLQAAVTQADLEVLSAQQAVQKLSDDLPDLQLAALRELKDARDAQRLAQQKLDGFDVSAEPLDVQVARSNVALAKHALDQANKDFKPYENKPEDNLKRAALLSKLSDAQERYDNAVKQLNLLVGVIVPAFDLQQAQTELEIAQTRLKLAEDNYAKLQKGPDPDALALAQANLKNAQDQAAAAHANLANLELKAPFAGTVSKLNIHEGEWIVPGQTILTLANVAHLRVETTDLSERDVPSVTTGQAVSVFIKALNQNVGGQVSSIAPLADTLGGDVVYQTTIDLDSLPDGLRAGMSVEVQFEAGP